MKHLFLLFWFAFVTQIIYAQDPAYPPAPAAPGNITAAEYFFDTDPGFGNGIPITVTPSADISNISFSATLPALADGNHILYIRSKDDWSITSIVSFLKGSPVPLRLISFSGIRSTAGIQLKWVTSNEINTSHFNIERSGNASTFIKTGEIAANNNSGRNEYNFTDVQPLKEINYYRLKQTDKDGRHTYSPVIRISDNGSELAFAISPNPASNNINIVYPGKKEMVTISMYDVQGRLMKQQAQKNAVPLIVPIQYLENGIYLIHLSDGETVWKARFIKQ